MVEVPPADPDRAEEELQRKRRFRGNKYISKNMKLFRKAGASVYCNESTDDKMIRKLF